MESRKLHTRVGPLGWHSRGDGPALVFFAGALANHDLWRDVVSALQDRYRCITIDLPLGAHQWPLLPQADRSATSLARLQLDCLELLDLNDATVIANDTAGGLLLLSLATNHPALKRVGRLVLTNCESYDKFPPPGMLSTTAALSRVLPQLVRAGLRLQARSSSSRRRMVGTVAATTLDHQRTESFFGAIHRDRRIAADLVAAMAGFGQNLLVDAADAIPRFDKPVLLIWGESCNFFPLTDAQRLAHEFPDATLVSVPGAKTWVPVDDPTAVATAITEFVSTQSRH
jgi:pimeloyl-ACP methyl ester carboxylesterase